MKSVLDLLDTIMRTPGVDADVKTRASFLRWRLAGALRSTFGV